jgi:hypothetical protein
MRERKDMTQIIDIFADVQVRVIGYARQIAIYRYSDQIADDALPVLVNGLQRVAEYTIYGQKKPGLIVKHDMEWLEFRDAFAQKTLLHQYHEAADVAYYAFQLEEQTGQSWLAADLASLRNYGLDPDLIQKSADAKYQFRASGPNNKNEAHELLLIEEQVLEKKEGA